MESKIELLEIYKLHVELSDKVSERRGITNKFYITILSGILALISFAVNDGKFIEGVNFYLILFIIGLTGILLCGVWFLNIKSYRQLNSAKFKVLHEIEEKFECQFLKKEWELLREGKNPSIYFRLSKVEQLTPLVLIVPYLVIFIYSICRII